MRQDIRQNSTDYKTFLAADRSDAFSMRGALTDVLVADGGSIFLRNLRFDSMLREHEARRPHLFSTSSLLDDTEHNRSYWVIGTGDFSRTPVAYPWIVAKALAVPYGLMLSFDEKTVWSVQRGKARGARDVYGIVAMTRPDPAAAANAVPDFQKRPSGKGVDVLWKIRLSLRPRAMVRAGGVLLIGGRVNESGAAKNGAHHTVATRDGAIVSQVPLVASPVWDGMAAAAGRLYVALEDGSVTCLTGNQERGE
jgi:hypothetical protein